MKYRFDQIAVNITTKKKPTEQDRFNYIGLEHLDSGSLTVSRWGSDVAPKGEKLLMHKGDVLFGKRRAYQKKVAIAPFDGIFSAHGMVLRPNEEVIDKNFFPMFISSDYFLDAAIALSVGSLSPTINWRDLARQEFELPPMEKQRELADVLWSIEDTRTAYQELATATEELVKSRFIEMFGDPVTNPMGWEKAPLADKCDIVTGNTPSRNVKEYYGDAIEWIKSDNITEATILTTAAEYLSEKGVEVGRTAKAGSILMTCIAGSLRSIGNVAIADRKVAFNQQINAILPREQNTYFMYEQFRLSKEYICSGVNMALKGILSKGQLSEIEFVFPPITLQNQFADFVALADKSKLVLRQLIEKQELLRSTLMQEYLG